jgi:hypothetical protein
MLTPMELLGGYVRIARMINAVAAMTNETESEVLAGYVEHVIDGGSRTTPEAYTQLVTNRVASGEVRPAPAPPAEGG